MEMPPTLRFAALLLAAAGAPAQEWKPLFDGKSLDGWRETAFTGRGAVRVDKGSLVLGAGKPLTGITLARDFPRTNYEVRFEAARLEGSDFFASLTFPVEDSFCTWVTGGWGGDIVGLSSLGGWDASDNETRSYFTFEKGRWYAFRLEVTPARIRAWIDDRSIVDVEIAGRTVSLRPGEIKLSAPFGFASYATAGALRKIEYRPLKPVAR
jgi:3-keto-disaccharide hydrolase